MEAKLKSLFSNLNKDNADTYIPDMTKYANAHFDRGNYDEAIPYDELHVCFVPK